MSEVQFPTVLKLVEVEWEDACSNSTWHSLAKAVKEYLHEPLMVLSVGWLVAENAERILLAPSIEATSEEPGLLGLGVIPRGMVKSMRTLNELEWVPKTETLLARWRVRPDA